METEGHQQQRRELGPHGEELPGKEALETKDGQAAPRLSFRSDAHGETLCFGRKREKDMKD